MSGALASLSAATSTGPISQVLGLLSTASFRGVVFEVLDSQHSVGRRWVQFLFPVRPDTVQEDLGAIDGPILLNALLIGDDYVSRARRLQAACKAAGPAMLRHPWLGQIKVVLAEPAQFTFDHQRMRLCRVQLAFRRWDVPKPSTGFSLSGLLDAIGGAVDQVQTMLADALAPLGDAIGALGMAQSALATIGGVYDGLFASSPYGAPPGLPPGSPAAIPGGAAAVAAAAAGPIDAMTGGTALVPGPAVAAQIARLMQAVPAAIALAGDPGSQPAIGPGPAAPTPAPADPRAAAALLLAAGPKLLPAAAASDEIACVLLTARVQAALGAAKAASLIPWTSRDEALAWRTAVDQALDVAQAALAAAVRPGVPALRTGAAWRSLGKVRSAWGADLTDVAGRLPAVQRVVTLAPLSAWTIAQAIAGDDPAAVRPAMLDLVARNAIRHPGYVPPGRLEILLPAAAQNQVAA